jgi:hypothetical protein
MGPTTLTHFLWDHQGDTTRQGHHTMIVGLLRQSRFLCKTITYPLSMLQTSLQRHSSSGCVRYGYLQTSHAGNSNALDRRQIHRLQALVAAVRAYKFPDNTYKQMLAIESLRAICKPPAITNIKITTSPTNQQMDTPLAPPLRVANLPNMQQEDWTPPPRVANSPQAPSVTVVVPRVP